MAGYPHMSEVLPQLASPDEVAPLLGMSSLGVVQQCRAGTLPGIKVGGRSYVHVRKLAAQLVGALSPDERYWQIPSPSNSAPSPTPGPGPLPPGVAAPTWRARRPRG